MRILYVGSDSIKKLTAAVLKKYPAFTITAITSLSDLKYASTRGEVIDRVIIFDSCCNADFGPNFSTMHARQQIQTIIQVFKDSQDAILECVCIAQSIQTAQYFIEELYEFPYNSAVFKTDVSIPLSTILKYSISSIAELRKTSCKSCQEDIYEQDDEVIWSTKKIVTSSWKRLDEVPVSITLKDKFRLSIALDLLDFWLKSATWEYKDDIEALKAGPTTPKQTPLADSFEHKDLKDMTKAELKAYRKELKIRAKQRKKEEKLRRKEEKQRAKEEKRQLKLAMKHKA